MNICTSFFFFNNIFCFDFYIFQAIHGLGSRQDVIDTAEAKSKTLDYTALIKELVDVGVRVHRNLKRLNEHSKLLAVHSSKIIKLETNLENIKKGNVL